MVYIVLLHQKKTIGVLAQAIVDLEKNQIPYKLVEPINHQIEFIGAELPLLKKSHLQTHGCLKILF